MIFSVFFLVSSESSASNKYACVSLILAISCSQATEQEALRLCFYAIYPKLRAMTTTGLENKSGYLIKTHGQFKVTLESRAIVNQDHHSKFACCLKINL